MPATRFREAGGGATLALAAVPLVFLALFFYYPLGTVLSEGLSLSRLARVLGDPYYLRIIAFTFQQALLVHDPFRGAGPARGLVAGPLRLPAQGPGAGPDHGALRAALDHRGPGLRALLRQQRGAERGPDAPAGSAGAAPARAVLLPGHPAGPRLLQLPDRRPHRGRAVEPPAGFHGGGRPQPGGPRTRAVLPGDPAPAGSRPAGRRRADLHLLLPELRRGAGAGRRPALLHPGGGGVPPGPGQPGPAGRRRAGPDRGRALPGLPVAVPAPGLPVQLHRGPRGLRPQAPAGAAGPAAGGPAGPGLPAAAGPAGPGPHPDRGAVLPAGPLGLGRLRLEPGLVPAPPRPRRRRTCGPSATACCSAA